MVRSSQNFAEFMTVGEAAEFLGVSSWTLRNWDKSGKLTPLRHPKNGYRIYRHEDLHALLQLERGLNGADATTPGVDWSNMSPSDHFVQFYENDEYLVEAATGFVAAAIVAGESAIVIGTREHRISMRQKLVARGLDISADACQWYDAAETLAKFMVDGSPDPRRFVEVVGGIVSQAARGKRRLRAFGEMVAILWSEGNRAGAVRLEELWNELAKVHQFALFCAYPIKGFDKAGDGVALGDVCKCHTRVIPAESYAGLASADERLRAITRLQQKAQSLETEIAHRREVEKALARREQELLDFVENAGEGLHKVAADGTILWANRAELKMLGYQAEEYIGHSITEFHVDADVIEGMLSKLHEGQSLCDCPARLRCKDSSIKYVEVNSNAFFEDGKLVYTRCFTRDVTARREAEKRQRDLLESERAARAEAERVSHMKDEFLATLSHELRTPLNAIFGWSQIVKQSPADVKTVVEGIAVIDRNVRIQTQLIEDLLDMSRIISGKVRLDVQRLELIPVLQAAVESVRPSAQARGIYIKQVLDPLAGPVSGDANRLQQVVWNLLSNAVKFTPKGGKIELLLERVNSHLEITVSDTGQGINPDFLPHVFERFSQADASTTRKHGGLGLSIVKQLVELHGGSVRVKSGGEGQGASFTVALPLLVAKTLDLSRQHPAVGGDASTDCSAIRLDGVKVLVVDDEPDARQLIARLLRDCEAEVLTAASAAEAIELLKRHHPQVLVSDIGMPETDGFELIRKIRSMQPVEGSQVSAVALHTIADGVPGEFSQTNVTVAAGKSLEMGRLEWKPVRHGKPLWEIGVPDRTAREYLHGDHFWQWELYNDYPKDFPNDVNFVVGKSDFHKDWNYCQ